VFACFVNHLAESLQIGVGKLAPPAGELRAERFLQRAVEEGVDDGLGRRTTKTISNQRYLDATYHYYYDDQRIVEVRNGSDQVLQQYVWAPRQTGYVDELVQIAMNDDPGDDTEGDGSQERTESNSLASSAVVFSLRSAARATFALKSAENRRRCLPIKGLLFTSCQEGLSP